MSLTVKNYDQKGAEKGTLTLPTEMFAAPINESLMHRALVMQQANRRHPIAHTKTRSEVRASSRKIYRQKGTGGARHGSRNANIFRHGGIAFGPRNTRNFEIMMPKNQRRQALFSALTVKANEKKILGLADFVSEKPSTQDFADFMEAVKISRSALIIMPEKMDNLFLSVRNLPNAKAILAQYVNIEDLLKYDNLIILEKAVTALVENFKPETVKTKSVK